MTVNDLSRLEGYKTLVLPEENGPVVDAYTGDLLSDVMGNAPADSVLITIQAHKNTVAVASLAGIKAIVVCNGRTAPDDMVEAAKEEEIGLFATTDNQFAASCKTAILLGKVDGRKD
jgi:hypothetical protein